jgi:hypothetical protein
LVVFVGGGENSDICVVLKTTKIAVSARTSSSLKVAYFLKDLAFRE